MGVSSLADHMRMQSQGEVHAVEIPDELQIELDQRFRLHPRCREGGQPPLRDMVDSFLASYEHSTRGFTPGLAADERIPPTLQYVGLVKCQFMMNRIQDSQSLRDQPPLSHWHRFVDALQEVLLVRLHVGTNDTD
jgi:hypothetical protein